MRVLVTGATGLIGKEVGKRLVESGHELVTLSRNPNRAKLELPFPAEIHHWQGAQMPIPVEALKGVEAVIHLAGEPIAQGRWTEEKKRRIRDSRVFGTRRLVEAFSSLSPDEQTLKVFVLGSAMGIYGDQSDQVITEDTEGGQDFLAEVVRDWEQEADKISQSLVQARVVKVRTGVVLSRREGALSKMLPVFTKGLGGQLGHGRQWMSWIHIVDIARLFVFCLENDQVSGVINGVAPEPVRNSRFTIELARALDRPVFLPVPEPALRLALGELSSSVLSSARVVPARAQELGFTFEHPEIVEALNELCEPLQGGQHELVSEQWLPHSPEEVFPFFCDEANLEQITPPFLKFHVLDKSTPQIREGTIINYRLNLRGIPVTWSTRIEAWVPNKCFIDSQIKGPYRKWDHAHRFIPFAGGTLMQDRVLYKLPVGFLGDLLAGWLVQKDAGGIFSYRRQIIHDKFGEANG